METKTEREELLDKLRLQYGSAKLHSIEANDGETLIVHRHANKAERRIYRGLKEEGKNLDAADSLLSCVVYPDKAALAELIEDAPFLVEVIENGVLAASGVYLDAVRKKL